MTKVAHHDRLGDINLIRSPINMSAFEQRDEFDRPCPDAGQHSEEILIEMGLTNDEIETLRNQGAI
jgi:crotonobetainyl-CoA:carnitine CoA-transferase CaiB-like acyl-CoA transferase